MRAYLRHGSRYVFTQDGVEASGPLASSSLDWRLFTRAHETASDFVLQAGAGLHILPKKDFRNDADIARLRVMLRESLGRKARLLGR